MTALGQRKASRRIRRAAAAVALAAVVAVWGCLGLGHPGPAAAQQRSPEAPSGVFQEPLRVATAAPGGRHEGMGQVLARQWERAVPGLVVHVLATAGSPQNVELLADGDADMAFLTGEVAYAALHGQGRWSGGPERYRGLRLFAPVYPEVVHLLARRDRPLAGEHLAGARLAAGLPGSREEALFHALLAELAGAGDDAGEGIVPQYLALEEALDQFQLGWIDGLFVLAPVPGPMESALENPRPDALGLHPLPPELMGAGAGLPWARPYTIPAGTYPGQEEPVRSLAVPVILAVREDVDEELVYRLAQAFYGSGRAALRAAYPRLRWADGPVLDEGGLLPLHPGVARYLADAPRLR